MFIPAGITEHPPPPPPEGTGLAVPEMVAWVDEPPAKLAVTVPEYTPTALGVMVTVTLHVAPAASMALLQVSRDSAMIAGWDSTTVPNATCIALGLVNDRLTVVEWPTVTVVAVTVGVAVVNGAGPRIPVSPMPMAPAGAVVGTDNVAEWLPAEVGV